MSALIGLGAALIANPPTAVAATPTALNVSAAVAARYDNNLFLSESDPIGAFSTIVAPRVDLQLDQRLIQGQLRYQAAAEWYRQEVGTDRLTQQAEMELSLLGARRMIRRLDLRLEGSFTRTGELPGTTLAGQSVPRGGVIFPSTTESTEWRGSILAGYPWTRRFQSSLEYAYIATYFDKFGSSGTTPTPTVTTYDSIVHDARLVFGYRQSAQTTLTLAPGWSVTRVVPSGTDFTASTETRTRARVTAGAEYAASSTSSIEGEVGLMVIEDDQARLALSLIVNQDWDRTRVRFRARQDSGVGGGVTDTVSITRSVNADASRWVARRTEVALRVGLIGHVAAPRLATDPTTRVVTFSAGLGLGHDLTEWLALRLDYLSQTQRSTGINVGGQRHLVTVALTVNAPEWNLVR
ncbi:MAG: hypothetical protein ACOYXU_12155 [Nitrospirota bacterium]